MNTLQVKCYLFPQNVSINAKSIGSANEIRRFALNGNSNLYEQLVDKIQSAYGELLPNKSEIKTYWQDEENELVGFSTDSEMQYACDLLSAIKASKPYEGNHLNGAVFKVYVARKVNQEEKPSSEEKPLHFGVTCDGCGGRVYGNRFKCNECPDYDLCEACEEKKLHPEHTKTKISAPTRTRCPYAGRNRAFHGRHNNQNCSNPANLSFQQQLNNLIPQITNNIPLVNSPDQLRNFGEYLKRFLDPIGIDVDYYIDGQRRSSNKPEEKPKTEAEKNKESKSTPVPDTNDLLTSSRLDEPMNEKEKTPEILVPTTSSESSSTASAQASAPSKDELIDLKSSPFESAANALKNVIEKNKQSEKKEEAKDESDFNLVDIEKELKIIRAIEQLKSMGYTDDGGWLTRLVTAKDANINAVLDAISPSKY